jgi:hypothetical protein
MHPAQDPCDGLRGTLRRRGEHDVEPAGQRATDVLGARASLGREAVLVRIAMGVTTELEDLQGDLL